MLERCRPLHAFDLGRLAGRGHRRARSRPTGEKMTTLDGVERTLTPRRPARSATASAAPQAIAGIMGGADAEVSDATTEILLESAYFEPCGHREDVEAARPALRGERPVRARHRPERRGIGRGARDGAARARSRRRARPTVRSTCIPQPIEPAAHHGPDRACEPTARDRCSRPARSPRTSTPLGIDDARRHRGRADVPARPRARDRPRSRRSRGASASTASRGPFRRARRRSAASRPTSATAGRSPTCSSARATTRSTRLPLLAPGRSHRTPGTPT